MICIYIYCNIMIYPFCVFFVRAYPPPFARDGIANVSKGVSDCARRTSWLPQPDCTSYAAGGPMFFIQESMLRKALCLSSFKSETSHKHFEVINGILMGY